jgi:hypothetical protein
MSNVISSCSDEEGESSLHCSYNQSSSTDAEPDESDHETNNNNKQTLKPRRLQKTRKISFQSNITPTTSKTTIRKDEQPPAQQQQEELSSNDDEDHKEINGCSHDDMFLVNRRLKFFSSKKSDHVTTTTTTDDDTTKYYHRYHPLDNLELNRRNFPSESNCSSPIPTITAPINEVSIRKANRFQVKSIRKSQQQHILLANVSTAKSSNDDDCSVPSRRTLFERQYTNTPTTDGENSTTNTDNIVNGAVSALATVVNGDGEHHRVRFHVSQHKKHESAAEEEKLPAPAVTIPTPAPPSSAASAQGEVSKYISQENSRICY